MTGILPIQLTEEESQDPAVLLAIKVHEGQYRKQLSADGKRIRYVNHPLEVRRLVRESDGSNEEVAAGVLHDVVEDAQDQEAARAAILALPNGQVVESIVMMVSQQRDKSIPWRLRMEAEIAELGALPPAPFRVKVCDELSNLRDVREAFARVGARAFEIFQKKNQGETLVACKARMMWFHTESVKHFHHWLEQKPDLFPPGCRLRDYGAECDIILQAISVGQPAR